MFDFFRQAMLAGVGAVTLTQERAQKVITELVEQGRISKEQGENLVKEMLAKADVSKDEWESRFRDTVQDMFRRMDLVPRKDLALLEEQLRILERRVAELERERRGTDDEVPNPYPP